MAAASNELESRFGTLFLRTATPAKPSEIWVSLHINLGLPAEDGENAGEVSRTSFGNDTGYRRVLHGPSDAAWAESAGQPGLFYNASLIEFPTPLYSWGTVTGFALMAADEGDGVWARGSLVTPLVVNGSDPAPVFVAGALVFSFL